MKNYIIATVLIAAACAAQADTTIDPAAPYAYGANIGWINAEADGINGVVVGQAFCSGYMYAANCGWICLGDGTPDDGMAYSNTSATDFGVNHDGLGNLTGYAYGANIGWINFEQTYGQPKVDLMTGDMSGSVWSANCGWISLDTLVVASIDSGPDTDGDGIPDWWEYARYGKLTALTATGDWDKDGALDIDEYRADTHPNDDTDFLAITDFAVGSSTNEVTWPAKATRVYTLQQTTALDASWTAAGTPFIPAVEGAVTETVAADSNRFYRVRVELP